MAANAANIGVKGLAAGTAGGPGSFGHKIGSYFKDQAKHGGLAADIATAAGSIIPGGQEVGMAAKAASMVASGVSKAGSVVQKVTGKGK